MLREQVSIEGNSPRSVEQDFTNIKSIGHSIMKRLHEAGILTYSQLALMAPEELATLFTDMPGMSAERIAQKGWIDQARQLAIELGENGVEIEANNDEIRQHYAVYTVELLLDEENSVRRTRVKYVQNQEENSWAGWEAARLIQFFTKSAALNIEELDISESIQSELHQEKGTSHSSSAGDEMDAMDIKEPSKLRLSEMPLKAVIHNQPFQLPLVLDMSNVMMPQNTAFLYEATVYTKKLGNGSRQIVGNDQGTIKLDDKAVINIPVRALSKGKYRIEAFVSLTVSEKSAGQHPELLAMVEGAILVR